MQQEDSIQKAENVGWGIIKWAIVSLVSLTLIGGFFWALLYSSYFANLSFIIPIRNFYQDAYWKIEGVFLSSSKTYPPFAPIYQIQVEEPIDNSGESVYGFWGTLSSINLKEGNIQLLDRKNNGYWFIVSLGFINANPDLKFSTNGFIPAYDTINLNSSRINTGDKLLIIWKDKRSLNQILSDHRNSPQIPINKDSIDYFEIIKF